jgi:polyferredoxin
MLSFTLIAMATQEQLAEPAETAPASSIEPPKTRTVRKKLIRRSDREYSQQLRRGVQFLFLSLNLYLGFLFYQWVRQIELAGRVGLRPPGVEGWLPIAGLMNLKYWLLTGHVPQAHPAAMFLLVTCLLISVVFRKAFCSWLCPVGTLSEYLWRAGRKLFRRNFRLPQWMDIPLRGLKYFLLGFFLWAVSTMSAREIAGFMRSPYGVIADVKMLNFFRHMGESGLIVISILIVASLFVQNFWCRYLCPYGALMGLAALFSPVRVRRDVGACIDCAKCAKACPSNLPVDKLVSIKSAECTGCVECVAVCPAQGALEIALPSLKRQRYPIRAWALAAGIAVLFVGIVGYAKLAGTWQTFVPESVYLELVPNADQASHPMPGDAAPRADSNR